MRTERLTYLLAALLLFTPIAGLLAAGPAPESKLAKHILVVYNSANPESETLARYYAKARGLDSDRVLGVYTSQQEEITRDEFNDQIRDPIDAYIVSKKWLVRQPGRSPFGDQQLPVMAARTNDIWAIVLVYGMPLKIAHDPKANDAVAPNAALNTNGAAVDSELTLLPYQGLPITGLLPNPYELVSYDRPFDALDSVHMVMVTRLDGPTPADVRRMIDDSIFAEKSRLVGNAYIDARGITDQSQGYFQGDRWLRDSAKFLQNNGWPVELDDKPALFQPNLPWTNIALYAGWYGGEASGPFMRTVKPFSRGAIAYHIHSFSATTLRSATANWCGPLIAKGVAATMGAVYEPYLDYMPQWDVFTDRLQRGYTYAEAAYASQKSLSWMITFIGDPLYRPFKLTAEQALKFAPETPGDRRDFLLIQQARAALKQGEVNLAKVTAEKAIRDRNASFVAWEGYAEIMSDARLEPPNSTVAQAYERALNLSTVVEDQVRTAMKCAQAYEARFRPQDSKRILSLMLARYPNESVFYGAEAYLKKLQAVVAAPTPKTESAKNELPPLVSGPFISGPSIK